MSSPLENLSGPGKPLKAELADAKEFEGLKRSGHARLKDSLNTSLAIESRFDLAYNAAHGIHLQDSKPLHSVYVCIRTKT